MSAVRLQIFAALLLAASLAPPIVAVPVQAAGPLTGKIVGIDPGHNGRNYTDPSYINHKVWNGREWESCDTTGTQTSGGYTEHRFNWAIANYLAYELRNLGA